MHKIHQGAHLLKQFFLFFFVHVEPVLVGSQKNFDIQWHQYRLRPLPHHRQVNLKTTGHGEFFQLFQTGCNRGEYRIAGFGCERFAGCYKMVAELIAIFQPVDNFPIVLLLFHRLLIRNCFPDRSLKSETIFLIPLSGIKNFPKISREFPRQG
ncbi:MAG: hypothetical protein ACLFPI_04355 [Desulfobacterales bacterium]